MSRPRPGASLVLAESAQHDFVERVFQRKGVVVLRRVDKVRESQEHASKLLSQIAKQSCPAATSLGPQFKRCFQPGGLAAARYRRSAASGTGQRSEPWLPPFGRSTVRGQEMRSDSTLGRFPSATNFCSSTPRWPAGRHREDRGRAEEAGCGRQRHRSAIREGGQTVGSGAVTQLPWFGACATADLRPGSDLGERCGRGTSQTSNCRARPDGHDRPAYGSAVIRRSASAASTPSSECSADCAATVRWSRAAAMSPCLARKTPTK